MKYILLLSFSFLFYSTNAQINVTGIVKDKTTNTPLQGVSIFVNNTSIGTMSDNDGKFALNTSLQKIELIFSYVGYETYQTVLSATSATKDLEIKLQPKDAELETVIVRSYDKDGWYKWGKFFTENFIGMDENADDCKLLNREVLRFYFDRKLNYMEVVATEPLIVENKALGYKVVYDMQSFTYNFNTRILFYSGYPFFTDLPGNNNKQKRWKKNRSEAYKGSIMHFMRAIYRNKLDEENFRMNKVTRVYNKEKERIKPLYHNALFEKNGNIIKERKENDTIRYYKMIMKQPNYMDYLDSNKLHSESIAYAADKTVAGVGFKNYINVVYTKKHEPAAFARFQARKPGNVVSSLITLLSDNDIYIYSNGMYYESTNMLTEGYWSWSEKMCNMLPFDYKDE